MNLSNSGRVILVDDNFSEVNPLMEVLGKNNIPYIYYDGKVKKLPTSPLKGVRFVFLDIELGGSILSDKSKASTAMGVLKRIISKDNGPYVIIFWSKHPSVIGKILDNCSKDGITPIDHLDLEKNDCIVKGKFDITVITKKLKTKLSSIGAFQLYVEWENLVNSSSKEFVYEFSEIRDKTLNWSKETSTLFYNLCKAYVGTSTKTDNLAQKERFKYASFLLNRSFLGKLDKNMMQRSKRPGKFKINRGGLNGDAIAKVNTTLFLDLSGDRGNLSGRVFTEKNKKLLEELKNEIFKSGKHPKNENIKLCQVVITPECDVARGKMLKSKNSNNDYLNNIHRSISGLLYKPDVSVEERVQKNAQIVFWIYPIWFENATWNLVLHHSTISTKSKGQISGRPLFSLQRDLFFDLQSKAAIHVNRLGNFMLG